MFFLSDVDVIVAVWARSPVFKTRNLATACVLASVGQLPPQAYQRGSRGSVRDRGQARDAAVPVKKLLKDNNWPVTYRDSTCACSEHVYRWNSPSWSANGRPVSSRSKSKAMAWFPRVCLSPRHTYFPRWCCPSSLVQGPPGQCGPLLNPGLGQNHETVPS